MLAQRNVAGLVHQQVVEDDDAGYNQWIKEAIENDSFGGGKKNRVRAWSRHTGLTKYNRSSNVYRVEFQWRTSDEKKMETNERDPVSKGPDDMVGYDSTSARSQLIAKHQKEMIKLVQDMPDSNYELTLQDIVENPDTTRSIEEYPPEKISTLREEGKEIAAKRQNSRVCGEVVLLKMFSPVTLEGKHKTNRGRGGSKAMPKRVPNDGPTMHEWMSRRGNGTKNNNEKRGSSCWSFFCNKK